MTLKLEVGRVYRGKRPRNLAGLVNDRQITWVGAHQCQYDSPSVAQGRHYPRVDIVEFLSWADRDVTDEMPKGEWQTWPLPKAEKPLKLTDNQIYTLRLLASGTHYMLRGDGLRGDERRRYSATSIRDVKAPSLPTLYKLGLIQFDGEKPEDTQYKNVILTAKGIDAVNTIKPKRPY